MPDRDTLAAARTPEQMEWIRARFKPDGLLRLARSTPDYYEQKGYYLPDVAALAYENARDLAAAREENQPLREALRKYGRHLPGCAWLKPPGLGRAGSGQRCDCDFDAALAAPAPEEEGDA